MEKQLFDANDLAAYMGIGRTRAYELMHSKGFPSMRIPAGAGKKSTMIRVRRDSLDAWLRTQEKNWIRR